MICKQSSKMPFLTRIAVYYQLLFFDYLTNLYPDLFAVDCKY